MSEKENKIVFNTKALGLLVDTATDNKGNKINFETGELSCPSKDQQFILSRAEIGQVYYETADATGQLLFRPITSMKNLFGGIGNLIKGEPYTAELGSDAGYDNGRITITPVESPLANACETKARGEIIGLPPEVCVPVFSPPIPLGSLAFSLSLNPVNDGLNITGGEGKKLCIHQYPSAPRAEVTPELDPTLPRKQQSNKTIT